MKPWEGKHWVQIIENYSGNESNLSMFNAGIHNAILNLTEALKKDWEERMNDLTPQGRALLDMIMNKGKR